MLGLEFFKTNNTAICAHIHGMRKNMRVPLCATMRAYQIYNWRIRYAYRLSGMRNYAHSKLCVETLLTTLAISQQTCAPTGPGGVWLGYGHCTAPLACCSCWGHQFGGYGS